MLEELKEQLISVSRKAELQGLCKNKSGNFSIREKKTGLIVISPTGINREKMTVDDVVVIDRNGKIVEAKTGLRPSSEYLMHLAAYDVREDICAVVHTHSRFAVTFAVLEKKIPAIVIEAAHLKLKERYIRVAEFARQGTKELGESVRQPLSCGDAILLAKHGVLTVGSDLEEALLKAAYVEEIAEIYYRVLTLGGNPEPLGEADLVLRYPGETNK